MSKDVEYFVNNPEEFELLTDDQKDIIDGGGVIEDGDTGTQDVDELKVSDDLTPEPGEPPAPSETEDKETVVLAKDGKHTIPYSELESARNRTAELEAFVQSQQQLIEDLKKAKIEDAGTGTTEAQDALLEAYQGDYPEIAEDMKPFIQKMIDDGIKHGIAAFQEQVKSMVDPVIKTTQEVERERYLTTLAGAHPDYLEVDQALKDWIMARPEYVRDAYINAYNTGTAQQAIELFTEFKNATGRVKVEPPPAVTEDAKAKAEKVIAGTKPKPPTSLTDAPSGTVGTQDEVTAMMNMNSRQLEAKFANKSPEEIRKMLDKLV